MRPKMSQSTEGTVEYPTVDLDHVEDTSLQGESTRNGQANRESPNSPRARGITSLYEREQKHKNVGNIPLSTRSTSGDSKQAFHGQLKEQVTAARHGHRGLDNALDLLCERMLTLEDCLENIMGEQKRAETRYHELRQSCLEHEQVLSAGNLQALTIRVDEIERLALTRAGCNPSQDMANVHDELQRLKRRIDIVSTNVLGDTTNAENDQHCARDLITSLPMQTPSHGVWQEQATRIGMEENRLTSRNQWIDQLGVVVKQGIEMSVVPYPEQTPVSSAMLIDTTSEGPSNAQSNDTAAGSVGDDKTRSQKTQSAYSSDSKHNIVGAQVQDISGSSSEGRVAMKGITRTKSRGGVHVHDRVVFSGRERARARWAKIKMHRALLVKKTRRQVMAERKVRQSETVVTRVERLEQALGVNAYTKGAGRLDVLARDVRFSVAMLVEHQARAASDALSAPLCLIPARQGDASVLPLVLPAAADEYASVPDSLLRSVNGGDSGMGAAEDGGVIDEMGKSSIGEDIEWIRMAEDTDYLYVELLLARTLDELAEGLAFASSFTTGEKAGDTPESLAQFRIEIERMQDRCGRLGALVGEVEKFHRGEGTPLKTPERRAATSEILRLAYALAGDIQNLLSCQDYCRVLDVFSFTPGRMCICAREFDHFVRRPLLVGGMISWGAIALSSQSLGQETARAVHGSASDAAINDPLECRRRSNVITSLQVGGSGGKDKGFGDSGSGTRGARDRDQFEEDNAPGFGVRPTLYQSLVLSMQHLASFLTAVRTRVANKAVASLHQKVLSTKNLASSAENAAHEAVDAARAAQMTARHASAEAMSATAGVAAATAAARHEGSVLLEELHRRLSSTMENERHSLQLDSERRTQAERERVGRLLEGQVGHLMALLDSKAGQEDVSSINRAMGDVKESLAIVTGSLPGDTGKVLTTLQEALSKKADKAHTKRQMSHLVESVSALLNDETDNPSLAIKRCLSCDRVFSKASFQKLAQQLPEVMKAVDEQDPQFRNINASQKYHAMFRPGPVNTRKATGPSSSADDAEFAAEGGGEDRYHGLHGTRPDSAPSRFRAAIEHTSHNSVDRPSSAYVASRGSASRKWKGCHMHGVGSVGAGKRTGVPASVSSSHQMFSPTPLSAKMGIIATGAREAVKSEASRAKRAMTLEPVGAPDHLRYGGMTTTPLVRQLFGGIMNNSAASGNRTGFNGVDEQGKKGVVGDLEALHHFRIPSGTPGHAVDLPTHSATAGWRQTPPGKGDRVLDRGGSTKTMATGHMRRESSEDAFMSTLEHHTRNVVNVDLRLPIVRVGRPVGVGNILKRYDRATALQDDRIERG